MTGDTGAPSPASSELSAARRARAVQQALAAAGELPQPAPRPAVRDPLPLCIYATVALLAWFFSPALVAALFALAGLRAYAVAYRAGLRKSDCVLGDPRWVMLYLGVVATCGLAWTGWKLWAIAGAWHG